MAKKKSARRAKAEKKVAPPKPRAKQPAKKAPPRKSSTKKTPAKKVPPAKAPPTGAPPEIDAAAAESYRKKREASAERERQLVAAGQEIGPIPPVKDPARRGQAEQSFEYFCSTYFPASFTLPWSDYHKRIAKRIEEAVSGGGLFAMAMPRGSGKTTMTEWGAQWAILTGRVRFVAIIGATAKAAQNRLRNIKTSLRTNDLLLEDFPEACFPIRALGRSARKAEGQKCQGRSTAISWKQDELVLPTITGASSSGAILQVCGITGQIRGLNYQTEDGEILRPQLAICDDPQTRESAKSPTQSAQRAEVLAGDVAYLAGPGKPIALIVPCTVVYQGDLADTILDRQKHPEFQGERAKMLVSPPANEKKWEEYAQLRADSYRAGASPSQVAAISNEFYQADREEMDRGAEVSWAERFNPDELSAIQHAMNLKLRDEAAFQAEYQNEPIAVQASSTPILTRDEICEKLDRIPRGTVPHGHPHLTAMIDVQRAALFWLVAAWQDDFSGAIVEYGAYPDQGIAYWSLSGAKRTLQLAHPGMGLEATLYAGLDALAKRMLGHEWPVDGGGSLRIGRCLVDANWGDSTETVYRFCRQSAHAAILLPSHGRGITASNAPLAERKKQPGELVGRDWFLPNMVRKRAVRHVVYDANSWKSFVHARLAAPPASPGCLMLPGARSMEHRMLADHLTAEEPVRTQGRGRELDEWKQRPDRPDNHWLDCLVGSAVAASMLGATLGGERGKSSGAKKPKRRMSDIQGRTGRAA